MITVIHIKNRKSNSIYIGRPSILQNPIVMRKETDRDYVCNRFIAYANKRMKAKDDFYETIVNLAELSKTQDIELCCFCAPKRCHGDYIKQLIERS